MNNPPVLPRRNGVAESLRPMRGSAFAALGLALAATALLLAGCSEKVQRKPDERVPVAVATVQQKNMPLQVHAIGNVEPLSTVQVKALVGGELTKVWFREGQDVHRGERLFTIDPRPYEATLQQAQANLARDEAQLRNAESQAARYADLVKKDYVTKEDYDRITSAADAAKAVVAADRAAAENARLQLSYCTITAPIDGRTGSLQVHAGNIVKANDTTPLVVINQIQPIYVTFSVPERDLGAMRGKMGTDVVATPQGNGGKTVVGKLTFVDNTVDLTTGTIALKATFPNADRSLWPGQYANVAVTLQERPTAVVIPAQAVQNGQQGDFVYVIKSDDGVEMRPVVVAEQIEQQDIIAQGVNPGETVVTDGQLKLTPKSKVEIKQRT